METGEDNKAMNKGDRVKLNAEGRQLICPRNPDRFATVVGLGSRIKSDCVRIQWDGTKLSSAECIHIKFLEKVENESGVDPQ